MLVSTPANRLTPPMMACATGNNRPVRDGSTWVEREVDKLPEGSYEGLRREQVLRRLEAYLKQGMSQPDALARLREYVRAYGPRVGQRTTGHSRYWPKTTRARE